VLEGKAMRKDEELETMEQVKAEVRAASDAEGKPGRSLDMDEELGDDQLLGDATLAKLVPTPVESTAPAVEVAVETPAVETPAVETPAVETPAVETPAVVEEQPAQPAVDEEKKSEE